MASQVKAILQSVTPKTATLVYGWHLSGPGPARFGWGWVWPNQSVFYIGRGANALRNALMYRADEVTALPDGGIRVYYYPNDSDYRASREFPS